MNPSEYDQILSRCQHIVDVNTVIENAYNAAGKPGREFYDGIIAALSRMDSNRIVIGSGAEERIKEHCTKRIPQVEKEKELQEKNDAENKRREDRDEKIKDNQYIIGKHTAADISNSIRRAKWSVGISIIAVIMTITSITINLSQSRSVKELERSLKHADSMLRNDTAAIRQTNKELLDLQKNIAALRDSLSLFSPQSDSVKH